MLKSFKTNEGIGNIIEDQYGNLSLQEETVILLEKEHGKKVYGVEHFGDGIIQVIFEGTQVAYGLEVP